MTYPIFQTKYFFLCGEMAQFCIFCRRTVNIDLDFVKNRKAFGSNKGKAAHSLFRKGEEGRWKKTKGVGKGKGGDGVLFIWAGRFSFPILLRLIRRGYFIGNICVVILTKSKTKFFRLTAAMCVNQYFARL